MKIKEFFESKDINFNEKQQSVFEKIISFTWGSSAYAIKNTLSELTLEYIRSEEIEDTYQEVRDEIAYHLFMINQLIDDLREIELNINDLHNKQLMFFDKVISSGYWDEDTYKIKNTLNSLSLIWIRSDRASDDIQETKDNFTSHMHLINSTIDNVYDFAQSSE